MNRLDESESTPKKRTLKVEEIVLKDAITKSGRKVKRPAHLDSPDRSLSVSPVETRKSTAPRATKAAEANTGTPGKRTTAKQPLTSPEEVRPSRKTIASARKATTETAAASGTPKRDVTKERQNPTADDESASVSKSGRKIKVPVKLMEFESEVLISPRKTIVSEKDEVAKVKPAKTPGRGKTPAKSAAATALATDNDAKNPVAPKTPGRRGKSVAPEQVGEEKTGTTLTTRTPKRKVSTALFDKEVVVMVTRSESPLPELSQLKTPGKRVVKSLVGSAVKTLRADSPAPEKAPPKTPGRRTKVAAVEKGGEDEESAKSNAKAAQTPGRRAARSMVNPAVKLSREVSPSPEVAVPKTPGRRARKSMLNTDSSTAEIPSTKTPGRRKKVAAADDDDDKEYYPEESKRTGNTPGRKLHADEHSSDTAPHDEPLSRSGRKIKPKRVFGFELEEMVAEVSAEKGTNDGKRKRKVDNAEDGTTVEAMMSPAKKKNLGNLASGSVQTPKANDAAESSPNTADGVVSRSGRKIKPKKMFGFGDGDSESYGEGEETPASAKTNTVRTPVKRSTASTVKSVKKSSTLPKDNIPTDSGDETDRSAVNSEPVIIRTSIGFGKPTTAKQILLVQSCSSKSDNITSTNVTPTRKASTVVEGSSQSSRNIEAKKCLDNVDVQTVGQKATIDAVKGKSLVLAPERVEKVQKMSSADKEKTGKAEESCVKMEEVKNYVEAEKGKSSVEAEVTEISEEIEEAKDSLKTKDVKVCEKTEEVRDSVEAEGTISLEERQVEKDEKMDMEDTKVSIETEKAKDFVEIEEAKNSVETEEVKDSVQAECPKESVEKDETIDEKVNIAEEEPSKLEPVIENPAALSVVEQHDVLVESANALKVRETDVESETKAQDPEVVSGEDDQKPETESLTPMETEELPALPGDTTTETLEERPNTQGGNPSGETGDLSRSDNSVAAVVQKEDGSETMTKQHTEEEEVSLQATTPELQGKEKPSETKTDAAGDDEQNVKGATEKTSSESSENTPSTVAEAKPEEVVSDEAVPPEANVSTEKTPDNVSFGDMEYLEDEVNNIVGHIEKPIPMQEALDSTSNSASNSSIVIIPETPAPNVMNETFSPVKPTVKSLDEVPVIDITVDTPRPVVATAVATPLTQASKIAGQPANDKYSPDKPPEIIEITDSPMVAAFCNKISKDPALGGNGKGGSSATSTPLAIKPALIELKLENEESTEMYLGGRKRSLSASAADMTMKRNVTFHSPANSTVLVETIDERMMMKSLHEGQQQERIEHGGYTSIGDKLRKPRKRSLSEHKTSEIKRNKISKVPNFKNIHANHFNRMESIADFMKRKETRAKNILSSTSPATKLLARPVAVAHEAKVAEAPSSSSKPFLFKSVGGGGGGIPVPSAGLFVPSSKEAVKPNVSAARNVLFSRIPATSSTGKKPVRSDAEKMANRMKQFQATFKPKQIGSDATTTASVGTTANANAPQGERPVEQLRLKQSKMLKGVRTNRRFELQMKHRDNLQQQ